jgi:hypothetical protein
VAAASAAGGTNTAAIGKFGYINRYGFLGTLSFYDVRLEGPGKRKQSVIMLIKFCQILTDTVGPSSPAAVPESDQPRASTLNPP